MDFVIQWLWYLLAFVVGSGVAWSIIVAAVKPAGAAAAVSDRPDGTGAQ